MTWICRVFGHAYQPRFSEVKNEVRQANGASNSYEQRIYEGDVCRCGATIDAEPSDIGFGDTATGSVPDRRAG